MAAPRSLCRDLLLFLFSSAALALIYDPQEVLYNLNTNETATDPLDYWGQWENHTFNPSPSNWRMPMYTLMLDRFANGDPTNDDANGTQYEHDLTQTQLRHGGDISGLQDSLDYLQGMGIKSLYIAGSPHINQPWESDGYSPLDLTVLDHHFGTIQQWQDAITEIHSRGMYVVMDNTMSTLGDLIGFEGYLNTSTPFNRFEHNALWKSDRRYLDFDFGNNELDYCEYPRFYGDDGNEVLNLTHELVGCRDSEFDQYGEIGAFGNYPEWQRQISKFAYVQDRLREWRPDVRAKIEHFACITLGMLDLDGYRMDKGLMLTLDAVGNWSSSIRTCAKALGKDNFYISGEIVAGNAFGADYIGRGRTPDNYVSNVTEAVTMTNASENDKYFIRDVGQNAFDGAAFHYTVYRFLCRILGMDGSFEAEGDPAVDWITFWNTLLKTNDMQNAYTGEFDPRHMFGVTNQDVFRWPGIGGGTQKQLLGFYITTLLLPGIPTLYWGEEQNFYVLDSTASNYVFGRSPMTSAQAWMMHGCYKVGNEKYYDFPSEAIIYGCEDGAIPLDHRDPSAPIRNIVRATYEMRENYPILNDGFYLAQLSKQTHDVFLPGSQGPGAKTTPTEIGLWSYERGNFVGLQNLSQTAWLVYMNEQVNTTYTFDCADPSSALVAPFQVGTLVKNLYYPYEEYTLELSTAYINNDTTKPFAGCLSNLTFTPWGFKAFVPKDEFIPPVPVVTKFLPGHDYRLTSAETVPFEIHFSQPMNCDQITNTIQINSTTANGDVPQVDTSSVQCNTTDALWADHSPWSGAVDTTFIYAANLVNVSDGIHQISVNNITTANGTASTGSFDHFLIRIGEDDNPMVFVGSANYSSSLLSLNSKNNYTISHKAPGADQFRYSLNFGTTYSDWQPYGNGGNTTIGPKVWSGTKLQEWIGDHIIVQYWSRLASSSDHWQEGDIGQPFNTTRRFPHLFLHGTFNQYGFDAGLPNEMTQGDDGLWRFNFMAEWPSNVSLNAWGMNPDGQPDQTRNYGDIDGDFILDRIPPLSLIQNQINITEAPPSPYLVNQIVLNDGSMRFELVGVGNRWSQLALYVLLWIIPILTGATGVYVFIKSFYRVKFNKIGVMEEKSMVPLAVRRKFKPLVNLRIGKSGQYVEQPQSASAMVSREILPMPATPGQVQAPPAFPTDENRRTVLIATMEYDIEDWGLKVKIGGLGVMAQLMGKNLAHQNLIWVVPCVGGLDFPVDTVGDPIIIHILGTAYEVQVQYHVLRNITYVLLDAPIFRQQTKSEPYPPRMDDLDSAVYYSAWNSCIAETIRRFPIDLYHINDYHGAVAPLHLLPEVIPCVLSLHNAEFQGLWPMRNQEEREEVCAVYDLDPAVVQKYVQFGEVFNLLHAAASYLRVHQNGFGAVGVSAKYGKRSFARYPILWGIKEVGSLPNPDPTDTAPWNKEQVKTDTIVIDQELENAKPDLKRQAQEWAGLKQDPNADLFVFVGRWSQQKGVDLIADCFPSVMENNPQVQLICVGPVIDLYGKFAAIKLARMMEVYPGRVFSKPEFTALPPYIFSGADFALMPSRDEPFGLVAVEFGRKGALCVGARVGGLGQMPGWWFTIESTTTKHLIQQFKIAIQGALSSKADVRAIMRARAAKQRFPVAQWVEDLEKLQSTAIDIVHKKEMKSARQSRFNTPGNSTPSQSRRQTPGQSRNPSRAPSPTRGRSRTPAHSRSASRNVSRAGSPVRAESPPPLPNGGLGHKYGPGHRKKLRRKRASGVPSIAPVSEFEDDSSADEEVTRTPRRLSRNRLSDYTPLQMITSNVPLPNAPFAPSGLSSGAATPQRHSMIGTPLAEDWLADSPRLTKNPNISLLSLPGVKGEDTGKKSDYKLEHVSPFFTDPKKEYTEAFEVKLAKLNGKTSEDQLCIEEYLVKSEKAWYGRMRMAEMGKSVPSSPAPSVFKMDRHLSPSPSAMDRSPAGSIFEGRDLGPKDDFRSDSRLDNRDSRPDNRDSRTDTIDEFLLGENYTAPTGLRHYLRVRFPFSEWPMYSVLLAFGQIIAANSYQITLLTGTVGEAASKLYVIASIYLMASVMWWFLYRRLQTVYVLSIPFIFYGFAFLLIGLAPFGPTVIGRGWIQNVATGLYAVGSASGSVYFAVNFGDEGGAPVTRWVYRACVIQGTQQIYVVALWYWGSALTKSSAHGATGSSAAMAPTRVIIPVGIVLAFVMWSIGYVLFFGLPKYYRQAPGKIPSFYTSLFRRKIIIWFFVVIIIQNYWLSAPYGRNWLYLWSSQHVPAWSIAILVVFFFVIVWAALLYVFALLSTSHSWVLPIFAMGLGAPRWAQMLWGTSNIGLYLPWAGGPAASAIAGRSLWLWLGVLDAVQGVGFGMILLQTLTRFHVFFTLIAAQVLGSIATILARATAPDKIGPGDVFPDFSAGAMPGLGKAWFWVALLMNLAVPVGFFMFFRKEQLSKP